MRDSPSNADIGRRWIWLGLFAFLVMAMSNTGIAVSLVYPEKTELWNQITSPVLLLSVIMTGVMRAKLQVARQLKDFSLEVTEHGLKWTGLRPGQAAWSEIGHLFVTGREERERLWVVGPGRWTPHPQRSTFISALARAFWFEGLLLDVPITALNVSAAEVTQEIENASGGKFPDYPPRPRGGESDEVRG